MAVAKSSISQRFTSNELEESASSEENRESLLATTAVEVL